MSNNLYDILKKHDDLSEQELLEYLQGKLSLEQQHAIEEKLADNEMMSDAEEGLRLINKEKTTRAVKDINQTLAQQLKKQRRKKFKKPIQSQFLIIIITFLLLVLIVLGYLIIYKLNNH